jgi:DhnA family fructose-bisphosphate aldolase class Ia
MNPGKSLRLRRIFTSGRAVICGAGALAEDPIQKVRALVRAGVDAAVMTPGLLEVTLEELESLSLVLRVDAAPRPTQLLGVESALIMGADAVLVDLALGPDLFARVSEDARRFGMPLFVRPEPQNWLEDARLAADYGADVILTRIPVSVTECRRFARPTGKPCLASLDEPVEPGRLLKMVSDAIEAGVQGVLLEDVSLLDPPLLQAIHGVVHQGLSAEKALQMFRP